MTDITTSTGYQPDWDIDLAWGENGETVLADVFARFDADSTTVEVKSDRQAATTGNIYVECMQKPPGTDDYKPSGVSTSTATYWVFIIGSVSERLCSVMVQRDALYWAAQQRYQTSGFINGGMTGDCPTKGVLLSLADLLSLFSQAPMR